MRKRKLEALLLVAVCNFAGAALWAQAQAPADPLTQQTLKLARVYSLVEQNYVDPIRPDQAILNGAVRQGLATLDPFSAFFDQDQFKALEEQARGQALGFGSILYVQPGKVLVLQTAEGSPSWRAGLGPGDEIVSVNGTRLANLGFQSLIQLLEKSRSQAVTLGVIHPGRVVPQDVSLEPAEVALPTVDEAFLLAPGLGYIHVGSFESKTPQELMNAILKLQASPVGPVSAGSEPPPPPSARGKPLKGLILDLRNNHGGMVDAAVGLASLFLKPDETVLTIGAQRAPTGAPEKTYQAVNAPIRFDFPLIVLVNDETASAAEVATAALEEHDRALVAGQPTYGKGVVEKVFPLSDAMGLALVTAQYFTPSGRSIQRLLPGTALAAIVRPRSSSPQDRGAKPASSHDAPEVPMSAAPHTDDGRPLASGGGITPDVLIPARQLDSWAKFLDQHGIITDYAADYLTVHHHVTRAFDPDSAMMADFEEYLERAGIRVRRDRWKADQDYLRLRIKTEVFNLVYGLAYGNEVRTRGDPQVQAAAALVPRVEQMLRAEANSGRR